MKTIVVFLLLALNLPLFSQQKQFKKACEKNTIESYEKFIEKYPDSEFADSAAYNKAWLYTDYKLYSKDLKVKDMRAFAQKYPNSLLIEDALYNIATITSTTLDWESYFGKFPDGIYRNPAEEMYYREVMKSKNARVYGKFVTLIPDSKYSEEVEYWEAKYQGDNQQYYWSDFIKKYTDSKYLEEAEFNYAKLNNDVNGWDIFISKYPNSAYAEDAEFMRINLIKSETGLKQFKNKYPESKHKDEVDLLINEISLWNLALHAGKFTDYQLYLKESKTGEFSKAANDTLLNRAKRHIANLNIQTKPTKQLTLTRLKSGVEADANPTTCSIQYIYEASRTSIRIGNISAFFKPLKSLNRIELPARLIDNNDSEFPSVVSPSLSSKTGLIIGDIEQDVDFGGSFILKTYGSYFIDSELNISNGDLLSRTIFHGAKLTYREETPNETTIVTFTFDNGNLKDVSMSYWGIREGNRIMSTNYEPKNTPLKVAKSDHKVIDAGTTQVILGNIVLKGYEFYSDNDNPLVFKMSDTGYVYVTGKGKIIDTIENKTIVL